MVGYHKRSDPATQAAKAEIDRLKTTGDLGKMTYVRILMPAGDWIASGFVDLIRDRAPYPDLERDPPASDMDEGTYKQYTAFVNYYIHQVNLLRHLLGEPYQVTYAEPSGVLLAGQSASGVACTIEMSPYRTTIDWQESALVAFERGYVKLELPAPMAYNRPGRVEIFRDPGGGATPETVERILSTNALRCCGVSTRTSCRNTSSASPLSTRAPALSLEPTTRNRCSVPALCARSLLVRERRRSIARLVPMR